MKRIPLYILFILVLPVFCYADSEYDGSWRMRESGCGYYSGQLQACVKSSYNFTVSNNEIYYKDEKVGNVTEQDENIFFSFDDEYLYSHFERLFRKAGYNVTIEYADITYKGTLENDRIKGKIRGRVTIRYRGSSYSIRLTGKFSAKRKENI